MKVLWKVLATVIGLLLTTATVLIAFLEHERSQADIRVSYSDVEIREDLIVKDELLSNLRRLEAEYSDLTSDVLLEVAGRMHDLDKLQAPMANEIVGEARDAIVSVGSIRSDRMSALIGELEEVESGEFEPPFEPLINEISRLESEYSQYTEGYLIEVLRALNDSEFQASSAQSLIVGARTAISDSVIEVQERQDALINAMDRLLDDIPEKPTKRLFVRVRIENHSQLSNALRRDGAVSVFGKGRPLVDPVDLSAVESLDLEGFSLTWIEYWSRPLQKLDERKQKNLEHLIESDCIVAVMDIHGTSWPSERGACVASDDGIEASIKLVNWLRDHHDHLERVHETQ